MKSNIIYNTSSEDMKDILNESIDMIVTSPPYNININYGNKVSKGKVL